MASASIEDIVRVVKDIENQKGKYIKQTLTAMEKANGGSRIDPVTRKAVMDGFNNFSRSVQLVLGYSLEK